MNKIVIGVLGFKVDNTSDAMIDSNDIILMDLKSEHCWIFNHAFV